MIDQCFVSSAIRRLDKTFSRLNTNSIRGCKEKLKDQRIVQTFRKLTSTDISCQLIQLSKPSKPDTVPEVFMSDLTGFRQFLTSEFLSDFSENCDHFPDKISNTYENRLKLAGSFEEDR